MRSRVAPSKCLRVGPSLLSIHREEIGLAHTYIDLSSIENFEQKEAVFFCRVCVCSCRPGIILNLHTWDLSGTCFWVIVWRKMPAHCYEMATGSRRERWWTTELRLDALSLDLSSRGLSSSPRLWRPSVPFRPFVARSLVREKRNWIVTRAARGLNRIYYLEKRKKKFLFDWEFDLRSQGRHCPLCCCVRLCVCVFVCCRAHESARCREDILFVRMGCRWRWRAFTFRHRQPDQVLVKWKPLSGLLATIRHPQILRSRSTTCTTSSNSNCLPQRAGTTVRPTCRNNSSKRGKRARGGSYRITLTCTRSLSTICTSISRRSVRSSPPHCL